jgi:hypothetical protein
MRTNNRELAKACDLCAATLSRALNGSRAVALHTREQVLRTGGLIQEGHAEKTGRERIAAKVHVARRRMPAECCAPPVGAAMVPGW